MQKYNVIYNKLGDVPDNLPNYDFPAIPSAFYFMVIKNKKIALLNNVGSNDEKLLSVQIFYSLLETTYFQIDTPYLKTDRNYTQSLLPLSLKGGIRQQISYRDWFDGIMYDDRFNIILTQLSNPTYSKIIDDVYLFPLNPLSDIFAAVRTVWIYMNTGENRRVYDYFDSLELENLKNVNIRYFPPYFLFFLLTRFYSYPLSSFQIELSIIRGSTQPNDPSQVFIDSVYDHQFPNPEFVIKLGKDLTTNSIKDVGKLVGTDNVDWIRWAPEYLVEYTSEPVDWNESASDIAVSLMTWTDFEIFEIAESFNVILPFSETYPNRYTYIEHISHLIRSEIS